VLGAGGVVVASAPERPEIIGSDWSNRRYVEQTYFQRSVFSDAVVDGPRGSEDLVVAVPLRDLEGMYVGALAGMFLLGETKSSGSNGDVARRVGRGLNVPEDVGIASLDDSQPAILVGLYDVFRRSSLLRSNVGESENAYIIDGDA